MSGTITGRNSYSRYDQRETLLNNQAASFGKAFLDLYNSDQFVDMCRVLRVLNAVRDFKIGLPLTYNQYTIFHWSG